MTDTHQYGCMENCTYKKTNSSDTGLYCFKSGTLQVTKCGVSPSLSMIICGNGQAVTFCYQCPATEAGCTSYLCEFRDGKCVPNYNTEDEVTATPPEPICGDGQRVDYCYECPATEEGCTSSDCAFNLLDGKCEPRTP